MEVTIRQEDTFWYVSHLFDVPLILIEKSNLKLDANQLSVGQRMQIPGYVLRDYTIKQNDTLWEIAMYHTLPMDAMLLVNPFVNSYSLQAGQRIWIPERVNDYMVTDVSDYTYEKMLDDINQLLEVYPFIKGQSIGQSVMGKDLIELQVGMGKKHVHVNGSFHANEWITTPVIIKFLNQYALSLTNNMPIRDIFMLPMYIDTTLSLVPMVNPDGVNLVLKGADAAEDYRSEVLELNNQCPDFSNWKANMKGVDLNKQFPSRWEMEAKRKPTSPKPRDYPGPHPLSEPESIAMANLAKTENFSRVNAFHTQGIEIYWGFAGLEPPISAIIAKEYARVSGYEAIQYIDNYAGYKDWFIQEFQKPGITVELGSGINPLPIEQFSTIYQESLGIMLANLYL